MKKRIPYLICFLFIITCLFPPRVVFAFTYETNKKVNISSYDKFRAATYGKAYDMDDYAAQSYGAQCWDGVQLLYSNLGMSLSTGGQIYAKYCWINESARAANTGTQFTQISEKDKALIKRGDIVVWYNPAVSEAGHIAFADEDYNSSGWIRLYGQNQLNPDDYKGCPFSEGINGKVDERAKYSTDYILGAFRYKKWADIEPPVINSAISVSDISTEGFTLSFQAEDNVGITDV